MTKEEVLRLLDELLPTDPNPTMKEFYPRGLDDPQCIVFRVEPESVRLIVPGKMDEEELP